MQVLYNFSVNYWKQMENYSTKSAGHGPVTPVVSAPESPRSPGYLFDAAFNVSIQRPEASCTISRHKG